MNLKKTVFAIGIAAVALAGSAASAFAASAVATDNVNVRSGPGGSYAVVDNLRRGQRVEIDRCRGSWCLVFGRNTEGWVAASYLGNDSRPVRNRRDRDVDVNVNLGFGGGYGGGYGGHHNNWNHGYRQGGGVGFYFGN
jgi:uncharacterized protein YraI